MVTSRALRRRRRRYAGCCAFLPMYRYASHDPFRRPLTTHLYSGRRAAKLSLAATITTHIKLGSHILYSTHELLPIKHHCGTLHIQTTLLALMALPPVLADASAAALLAMVALPPVLTDTTAAAILTLVADPPVLAGGGAAALHAHAANPPVFADATPSALLAPVALPPVNAQVAGAAILATVAHPTMFTHGAAAAIFAPFAAAPVLAEVSAVLAPAALLPVLAWHGNASGRRRRWTACRAMRDVVSTVTK